MFTSIAEKIMAGVIALLVIGGTALGLLYRHERAVYQKASADLVSTKALYDNEVVANAALQKDNDAANAAYSQLVSDLQKLQAQQNVEHQRLQDALKANAEWSNGTVPDAVFNSLFGDASQATDSKQGSGNVASGKSTR